MTDRSALGRRNRNKGAKAERDLARYLRVHGWPDAERKPDNGWRTYNRESPDAGDIKGTPRLVWQVKARPEMSTKDITTTLAETADQAVVAAADYGLLIQRRTGHAHPGAWWAWLTLAELTALIESTRRPDVATTVDPRLSAPVRLELATVIRLLHQAGYGHVDTGDRG
jgi:hypothetical protein